MRREGDYNYVTDVGRSRRITALGVWTKHWYHWEVRWVAGTDAEGPLEIPFLRCAEEQLYVKLLVRMSRELSCDEATVNIYNLKYYVLSYTVRGLTVVNNRNFWATEFKFEKK